MTVEVPPIAVPEWTYLEGFACERLSASRARAFVSHQLIEHRLLRLVDPVRAAVSELAANAIVHARTPFTVTLSRAGQVVELRVEDAAHEAPVRQSPAEVLAEGGRGLNIIAALSRDWGVTADDHAKSVWARFEVRRLGEGDWS